MERFKSHYGVIEKSIQDNGSSKRADKLTG
jgi:hypothetical protein